MWQDILKKVGLLEEWIKSKMAGAGLFFTSHLNIGELTITELQYLSNVTQSQYEELFESLFNSAKEKDKPSDEDEMHYWSSKWSINTSLFSYDVFKDSIDHTISWRKGQKERDANKIKRQEEKKLKEIKRKEENYGSPKRDKNYEQHLRNQMKNKNKKRRGRY
tara:strand:- start:1234 stop:1722 length:489 start_codon:yes stop_codon:yes gene_type:complete